MADMKATPSNTSFKKELREILLGMEWCHAVRTDHLESALTSIINLVDKELSELGEIYPRPASQKDYDFNNNRHRYTQGVWVGYNQAQAKMRAIIRSNR